MAESVGGLTAMLQQSLDRTLAVMARLDDADLDQPSDHPCAMGGTVRDLLTHNIDHERMHAGQIFNARYNLKAMQTGEVHRLMAELLRARTDLIASLIGFPDDLVDAEIPEEDWSIREMIEHTVYWDRHSMDDLARRRLRDGTRNGLTSLADPLYGPLPVVNPADIDSPTPVPPAIVRTRAERDALRANAFHSA